MTTPPWGKNAIKRASPYQRIMIAAEKGRGLRFSSIEVRALSMDAAIAQRAAMDTTCVECPQRDTTGCQAEACDCFDGHKSNKG
jgi:hypothetical protein